MKNTAGIDVIHTYLSFPFPFFLLQVERGLWGSKTASFCKIVSWKKVGMEGRVFILET